MTPTHTRSRSRSRIVGAVASLLTLTLAPIAPAAIIATTPQNFAALSGSTLTTGTGVTIGGNVGAIGDLYFNNNNVITGSAYSNASVQLSNNTTTGNVIAGTYAYFNNNASAGTVSAGTTIGLDNNATTNSLRAGTGVSLNNNSVVTGSVNAGTSFNAAKATVTAGVRYGSSYSAASNASITGPVTQGSVLSPDSWSTTLRTNNLPSNSNSNAVYYAPSTSNTLSSGSYGGLTLDGNSTLTLTAGTYNFSSLYLNSGAKILANTSAGNVIINIASTVSTAAGSLFSNLGTGSLLMQTGGSMYLNSSSRFEGSLISYSTMTLDQGTIVTGSVYSSGAMYLNNNVNIGGAGSLPVIPEPASVSLLLIGGASLLLRRPMRRAARPVSR